MPSQIFAHTPAWVFMLFAALVALGCSQMRTREVTLARAAILPLVMAALSLAGTLNAFPGSLWALASWAVVLVFTTGLMGLKPVPNGTVFNAASHSFTRPGSAVPLALMMGVFFTRYAVGASLGLRPDLAALPAFACAASAAFGLFSGLFLARGLRLWRLAMNPHHRKQPQPATPLPG